MVYNGQQIKMKKLLIVLGVMAVFFATTAFVSTGIQVTNSDETPTILKDNGWEDYTTVTAYAYKKNKDGEWVKGSGAYYNTKIQRREWCGEPEYRAKTNSGYYPVSKSPIKEYKYCFYINGEAAMFDM